MHYDELAPAASSPVEALETAIAQLREALTMAELTAINKANEELRAAVLRVQPQLTASTNLVGQAVPMKRLKNINREIRIAGELLVRANAANRRALHVFSAESGSYGPNGL